MTQSQQHRDGETLIHRRVAMARAGENETVICRMASGWAVLGDDQRLPGYSLLLHDPVHDNLNELAMEARLRFLSDMTIIGDALMAVLEPSLINYSVLGNTDRALHAHIHPRYDHEAPEKRRTVPFIYHLDGLPYIRFDPGKHGKLRAKLKAEIQSRAALAE